MEADRLSLSSQLLFSTVTSMAFAVVGALIAVRQPHHRMSWLFGAVGFLGGLMLFSGGYALAGLARGPSATLPGLAIARWLGLWTWVPLITLPATFILLLFPDGRLPSRRWQPIGWAAGLGLAGLSLLVAFHPGGGIEPRLEPNPFGISAVGRLEGAYPAIALLLIVGVAGSVAALLMRFWRSRGLARQQFKWLVSAGLLALLINVLGEGQSLLWPRPAALQAALATTLELVSLVGIVAAAGIAILRYRLYDVDLLINRTLVYGLLTAGVVGLYVIMVGLAGRLWRASGELPGSLLATVLAAVLFQPLRVRLQRGVNRLMYGERDEPYVVLSRLGQHLEATLASEALLPAVAKTVAQALKLPYAAIELEPAGDIALVAGHGLQGGPLCCFPLVYQGQTVGRLLLAPRAPGEQFTPTETRLIEDIARQAGVAAHAVRLAADLRHSRERLVTAREEERRRLRRDLHDGLGPKLAGQTLKLEAARDVLDTKPDLSRALLNELIDESQSLIGEIRRLVYGLRPPALDELGLRAAVCAQAAQCQRGGLRISVAAPEVLPPLPAAIEVAAFRIVQEALTNVIRHSGAQTCQVSLAIQDGGLQVEVVDDGVGLPAAYRTGVGLASMRERAEEIGGACKVEAAAQLGTRVSAWLPLPDA